MKSPRFRIRAVLFAVLLVLARSGDAHAEPVEYGTLIDYGNGLIYDTVQDLTWLDTHYAAPPRGAEVSGDPCWTWPHCDYYYLFGPASQWVSNLSYMGYDD